MKWGMVVNHLEHFLHTRRYGLLKSPAGTAFARSVSPFLCGTTRFMMQDPIIVGRSLSRAMSSSDPWPHSQFVSAYVLISSMLQLIAAAAVTYCLLLGTRKNELNSRSLSALTVLVVQHGGEVVSCAVLQKEGMSVGLSLTQTGNQTGTYPALCPMTAGIGSSTHVVLLAAKPV